MNNETSPKAMLIAIGDDKIHPEWMSLEKTSITIGRLSAFNDIQVRNPVVSRVNHAEIHVRADGGSSMFYIIDHDSLNGTFVNKTRVVGEYRLQHGDVISLGQKDSSMFEFSIETEEGSTLPDNTEPCPSDRLWFDGRLFYLDQSGENRRPLPLAMSHYRLLEYLYQHRGTYCSREECIRAVWGRDTDLDGHRLNVLLSELRKKLNQEHTDPDETKFIHTLRSHGIMLNINPKRK